MKSNYLGLKILGEAKSVNKLIFLICLFLVVLYLKSSHTVVLIFTSYVGVWKGVWRKVLDGEKLQ